MREVCNMFVNSKRQPRVGQMMKVYRGLRKELPRIRKEAGGASIFSARCFSDITLATTELVDQQMG